MPLSSTKKNVLTLLAGNVFAQVIPVLLIPLLTRIYSPVEFGQFGLYMAIISVLGVIVALRFEFAILQPKTDKQAKEVLVLGLLSSAIISLLFLVVVTLFNKEIVLLINEDISTLLYFVPLSVFFMGVCQCFVYWMNRRKSYKDIAKGKVAQSSVNSGVSVVGGLIKQSPMGLVAGNVFGNAAISIFLFKKSKITVPSFNLARLKSLFLRYHKYPTVSVFGALLNNVAVQAPLFFISHSYQAVQVGYFNLINRTLASPLALISAALSQVLYQKVASEDYGDLHRLIVRTAFKLFAIMVPLILVVLIGGGELFSFAFGQQWYEAGDVAKVLIFSIAIRFVVSPLSVVLLMDRFLVRLSCWQGYSLVSVIVVLSFYKNFSFDEFLIAFLIQDLISYTIYFVIITISGKQLSEGKALNQK